MKTKERLKQLHENFMADGNPTNFAMHLAESKLIEELEQEGFSRYNAFLAVEKAGADE